MITPTGNRVLVKLNSAVDTLEGGIYVPKASQDKPQDGTVINVGPKVTMVTQGDRVLIPKFAGTEIERDTYLLSEDDVLAIVE